MLDGIVLGAAISRELRFLAKVELWRSRLLAWMLDGLGAIPIERGEATPTTSRLHGYCEHSRQGRRL